MKTFKETDDLGTLEVGDELTLTNGMIYRAVSDTKDRRGCRNCIEIGWICSQVSCGEMGAPFHFERKPNNK